MAAGQFQTLINADPAPGLEGGWCSANPHASMLAGPGTLVSGPAGVIVGRFAFARNDTGVVTNAHPGVACRNGFVHRSSLVLISPYLGTSSFTTIPGADITLFDNCDVWARFAAGATIGQKVFCSYADGSCIGGVAGTPPTATGVTATTTNGSPNLTAVAGGTLLPGQMISGAGIPAGTFIVSATGATAVMSANATASAAGVALTQATAYETNHYVHGGEIGLATIAAGNLAMISQRKA